LCELNENGTFWYIGDHYSQKYGKHEVLCRNIALRTGSHSISVRDIHTYTYLSYSESQHVIHASAV